MSYVTTVIIISPSSTFPDEVNEFLTKRHHTYYEEGDRLTVLEARYGNEHLFSGGKYPGGSMVWIGWNYCYVNDLIEELKAEGFKDLTVWWETEGEFMGVEKINWTYPRI